MPDRSTTWYLGVSVPAARVGTLMPVARERPVVPEDASLDDFLDAGDDGESPVAAEREAADDDSEADDVATAAEAGDGDAAGTDASDGDPPSTDDVEPAVSTYTWAAAGGACATCGESVDRRWRADDDLVCADCKEW
jgi:hypothetical protein